MMSTKEMLDQIDEEEKDLIKKADAAQRAGDYSMMKKYDRLLENRRKERREIQQGLISSINDKKEMDEMLKESSSSVSTADEYVESNSSKNI
ncbi:MAG: hypothetical protein IKG58_00365 [Bacilli bacterium]|nr:hypothetical protein [Bacilli bacterium]MBR3048999.1 hypothetical protein [Bacilli bacterium]